MFTEPLISENGEIKEISSVVDLDFGIRKLSVSPMTHEGDYLRADESPMGMVTGDVSCTDFLLSDFDSMSFDVHSELPDGLIDIFKSDAFNSCDTDLVDSISIPEPSIQRNDEVEILGEIDEADQLAQPLIVYTSARRRSTRNKSNTGIGISKTLKSCRDTTKKNSIVDLSSLQSSRRRRSVFTKRARSSVWGSESNILPHEKHRVDLNFGKGKRPSRRKSVQSIGITDQASVKSGKSCAPTGLISLKIRIGSQRYDVGNVNGSLDSQAKNISRALTSTEKEVPGNRGSDAGTSPDSEVINSVPDITAFDDILPLQEFPTIIKARVSSGDESSLVDESSLPDLKPHSCKKKDKLHQLGHSSLESKLTVAKNDIPEDPSHCPRVTCTETVTETFEDLHIDQNTITSLKPQECETLLPCSRQNIPKHSGVKKESKRKSKSIGLQRKKDNASKKKGGENSLCGKGQVKEEDANGANKALASYLVPGHQSSTDVGEASAPRKDLSGCVMNSLQSATSGEMDHIVPVRNAWVLCDVCQKWRRIPATLADQIEETKLGWTCKDNMDKDFADCSIPQEKSNSEINEELEISDGEDAGEAVLTSEQNRLNAGQMSLWSAIKSNLFLQRNRKKQTIDEVMVCHCEPPSDGRMGCRSKCLNRILNIECVKGTCPCGERCSNQQFQKRKYARLQYFKCGKKGYGLQALENISDGQFLIEYVGEVLDMHAYEERQKEYAFNGHRHFYFMTLNGSEVIDACAKGNLGRFINHSCDPNCRTEKWMVNGEVCVGLFALRDIKEGEEVTFDYNYVRVFGAAAKRCVCGSQNCRGYIGGDPKNSEIIVQGDSDDDYPEPVMIREDSRLKPDFGDAKLDSLNDREKEISRERPEMKNQVNAVGQLGTIPEALNLETLTERVEGVDSACADGHKKTSIAINMIVDKLEMDDSTVKQSHVIAVGRSGIKPVTELGACMAQSDSLQSNMQSSSHSTGESIRSMRKTLSSVRSEISSTQNIDKSLSPAHESEEITTGISPSKSLRGATECKMKLKNGGVGRKNELAKSKSLAKSHRPSPIKKGKIKAIVVNGKGSAAIDKLNEAADKSKKQSEVSTKNQFETVEEKLNDWLEPGGGISKRKDASRGYLQLLFLTAASGGHGESIRELSMILDALLKTRSRTVLVDIINKNGLQMLHNILKRCCKVFNKTPVLRKLLKVLEYLAIQKILTMELIAGGPPRPGVESFKDSILALSEHDDKQVHQSARNFRDRWIPKGLRNSNRMERDDGRSGGSHARSRHSESPIIHDKWSDRNGKPSETGAPSPTETPVPDPPVSNTATNEKPPRKRKSRWDVPEDNSRLKTESSPHDDDDAPPGFSTPIKNPSINIPTAVNHTGMKPCDFVWGYSQPRFVSRMPLSYGIPSSVLKVNEISTGVQFHPFPPLPQCAKLMCESDEKDSTSGKKHPRTWSVDPASEESDCKRGGFQNLGRAFRQQKPSQSKLAPPWVRMRQG